MHHLPLIYIVCQWHRGKLLLPSFTMSQLRPVTLGIYRRKRECATLSRNSGVIFQTSLLVGRKSDLEDLTFFFLLLSWKVMSDVGWKICHQQRGDIFAKANALWNTRMCPWRWLLRLHETPCAHTSTWMGVSFGTHVQRQEEKEGIQLKCLI